MSEATSTPPLAYAFAEAVRRRAKERGRDPLVLAIEAMLQGSEPEAKAWLDRNYPDLAASAA